MKTLFKASMVRSLISALSKVFLILDFISESKVMKLSFIPLKSADSILRVLKTLCKGLFFSALPQSPAPRIPVLL